MPYFGLPTTPWEQAAQNIELSAIPLSDAEGGVEPYNPPREFQSPAHAVQWCKDAGWYPSQNAIAEYPGPGNPQALAEFLQTSGHITHSRAQLNRRYAQVLPWVGCGGVVAHQELPAAQRLTDLRGMTLNHDDSNKLTTVGYWIDAGQQPARPHHSGMGYGREGINTADSGLLSTLDSLKSRATIDWVRQKAEELFSYYRRNANLSTEQWQELKHVSQVAQEEEGFSPTAMLEYLLTKYALSGFSQTQLSLVSRMKHDVSSIRNDDDWQKFLILLKTFPHLPEYEIGIAAVSLECKTGIDRILYNVEHLTHAEAAAWISNLNANLQSIDTPTRTNSAIEKLAQSEHISFASSNPEMHLIQTPVQMPPVGRAVDPWT